jgi:hypothetical protein
MTMAAPSATSTRGGVSGSTANPQDPPVKIALNMLTGALGLLFVAAALMVAKAPRWPLSALDAGYWGLAIAMATARYLEVRRAQRAEPKTDHMAGWRRFAGYLGAIAVIAWVAAHVVQVSH